jgi:hypothetical protein
MGGTGSGEPQGGQEQLGLGAARHVPSGRAGPSSRTR